MLLRKGKGETLSLPYPRDVSTISPNREPVNRLHYEVKSAQKKTADGPDLVYSKAVCGPKTHPNFYHRYTAVNV